MAQVIDYIFQTSLIWMALFGVYKLLIEKSNWLIINRIILWLMLTIPLLMPIIEVNVQHVQVVLTELPKITISQNIPIHSSGFNWLLIVFIFYLVTAVCLMYSKLKSYLLIINHTKSAKIFTHNNEQFHEVEDTIAYNVFQYVFIGKNIKHLSSVLDHEMYHKKAFHSLDLLIINVLRCLFWVFPFWNNITHLFVNNHEFYVDKNILKTHSLKEYISQIAQVNTIQTESQLSFSNNQMSIFKTRLQMMQNKHKSHIWRYMTLFLITGIIFSACSKSENNISHKKVDLHSEQEHLNSNDDNWMSHTLPPSFKTCENRSYRCFSDGLANSIKENLIYPEKALLNNYEGTVHVAFEYSTLGFVQNVSIDKPSKYDVLNKEALRLGNLLPKAYEPAVNYGKITTAAYSIPIEFKIQKQ